MYRYRLAWRWRGTEELGTTFLCGGKLDLAKFLNFQIVPKISKIWPNCKIEKFRNS